MFLRKNVFVFLVLSVFVSLAGVAPFFHDCDPGGPETGSTDLAFERPDSDDTLIDPPPHLNLLMPDDFSGVSFLIDSWQDLSSLSFQGSRFHHPMVPLRC